MQVSVEKGMGFQPHIVSGRTKNTDSCFCFLFLFSNNCLFLKKDCSSRNNATVIYSVVFFNYKTCAKN